MMIFQEPRNLEVDDVFHYFRANTGERDWPVIFCILFRTFLCNAKMLAS